MSEMAMLQQLSAVLAGSTSESVTNASTNKSPSLIVEGYVKSCGDAL
jgi:hypothetical protein